MPGYVIHLAVAEEYLKKHKEKQEEYNEFINGVIFPDSIKDKLTTHYGEKSSVSNLYEFLKANKTETSFKRGYFLHLLTDYLFYNKYIDKMSKDMYNDYDILNRQLIEKYDVKIPESVRESVLFKEGPLTILSLELVTKMIEDISNMDLEDIEKEVYKDPIKWTTMRKLKRF